MLKTTFFWSGLDQAIQKLRGTCVLYDNEPCFIESIEASPDPASDTPRAFIKTFERPGGSYKRLSSKKFNRFQDLPNLGYTNTPDKGAVFYKRAASTSASHGLSASNTRSVTSTGDQDAVSKNFFISEEFRDSHLGIFPPIATALELSNEKLSIAISRELAVFVSKTACLLQYKASINFGVFSSDGKTFYVFPGREHLKNTLENLDGFLEEIEVVYL
jgi:hypothetical protein